MNPLPRFRLTSPSRVAACSFGAAILLFVQGGCAGPESSFTDSGMRAAAARGEVVGEFVGRANPNNLPSSEFGNAVIKDLAVAAELDRRAKAAGGDEFEVSARLFHEAFRSGRFRGNEKMRQVQGRRVVIISAAGIERVSQ